MILENIFPIISEKLHTTIYTVKSLILQILILTFLTTSCESQELNVTYDNIEINIPGRPGPWLKYGTDFYCYFKTDNDKFSSGSNHQFYILDKIGQIKSQIEVPKKLQTTYYDLYLKNDTIFTTEYYDHNTFYLDQESNSWIETRKREDIYYEDEDYLVYSLDFGEWGGVTWFKNKQTNKQFEIGAITPSVNKLDNAYYLTTGKSILKIDDPTKLEESKEPYIYQKAVLDERFRREGSHSTNGAEIIFEYNSDDYFNPKFSLTTSFVSQDKLYHLFRDSLGTQIGRIIENELVPIYTFDSDIKPFYWHYDTRNPIQNNNFQTVQFNTNKDSIYGIIEINPNNVNVVYFKNSYKEPIYGKDEIKIWFEKTFEYYYSIFDKLTLDQIDSVEQNINATDITQKHKISTYHLDGRDVETPRIYRKMEDGALKLITMYYYTKDSRKIELINFEWGEYRNKNQSTIDVPALMSEGQKVVTLYKPKYDWISNYLKGKFGEPTSYRSKKSGEEQKWEKGNVTVLLDYSNRYLELIIYKK